MTTRSARQRLHEQPVEQLACAPQRIGDITDEDRAGIEAIRRLWGGDWGGDADLGRLIGSTPAGVRTMRSRGRGPRAYRPAKSVRYFAADVWEWLKSRRCEVGQPVNANGDALASEVLP